MYMSRELRHLFVPSYTFENIGPILFIFYAIRRLGTCNGMAINLSSSTLLRSSGPVSSCLWSECISIFCMKHRG